VFDDLKIRSKLILLVAGPIVIIVLLAAIGSRSRQDTADASRRVERLVGVAQANGDVVDALQAESLTSTSFVASDRSTGAEELEAARADTDRALETALAQLQGEARSTSSAFRSTAGLAVDSADKLTYIREAVDQGYRWEQVATTYAAVEQTFLAVNDTVAEAITDPQVAGNLRTGAALASYKAALARQGSLLAGGAEQGGFSAEGSFALFQAATDDEASQQDILTSVADSARKGDVRDALTSEARIEVEAQRDEALAGGSKAPIDADPAELRTAVRQVLDDLHEVETELFGTVIGQSQAARADAERAADLFLIAAGVAILAAALAALFLGRRITRPLDKLTVAADRLASEQMPRLVESLRNPSEDELDHQLGAMQAIEVSSNDEIGQLASSFNDVQRVASEVAAEQAALLRKGIGEMFVNLARRNQALLDRQIDFIDELERGEEDPDQLENLYRLDHLATRMRRNAESLLVLAGAEPPRRRGRPAPLANVVRAALAEVEDFNRIELLSFDEVLVASNAAADLAHLLSELMENATNFSPPETRVEVVGHRTKADGYVISVSDHGIGMSPDQIAQANESLAKPPLVGLALSRSLGFIVVGRLARRHGIAVRMMPSPAGGVTAVVSLPPQLVTDGPSLVGATEPAAAADVPSRLKPVLDTSAGALPPLAFTPDGDDLPAPATLAEAVPTGQAFETGLDALVAPTPPATPLFPAPPAAPAPSGPSPSEATGTGATGLPTRRLTATPAGARPTGDAPERPAPTDDPGPTPAPEPAAPGVEPAVARVTEAPQGDPALPEALVFSAPPTDEITPAAGARLDGPPPAVPSLPVRERLGRPAGDPPAGDPASRPFFLEGSEPPRLFGRTPDDAPTPQVVVPPAPPAPSAEPTRLFGATPPAAPEPVAAAVAPPAPAAPPAEAPAPDAPAEAATAPLARRQPAAPDPGAPTGAPVGADEPVRTTSGLAKRVPRQAGATRAIPGADAERGVSATRRSPDEVRNLLSRYRDGQQRARVTEPVPGRPSEEMENHE
jgi:signal transduction histidine kinase